MNRTIIHKGFVAQLVTLKIQLKLNYKIFYDNVKQVWYT